MTTDRSSLIRDLKSIPSPVFYIFAAVALFSSFFVLGFNPGSIITAIFLLSLVACAAADINAGIVPDIVVIFITLLAVINFLLLDGFSKEGLIDIVLGGICVSLPMLIISLIVRGAFGGGDIKLMAACGLFLGFYSTLTGALIGMLTAGIYGIYLLLIKKAGRRAKIKLVPFLALGLSLAALFENLLISLIWFTNSQ